MSKVLIVDDSATVRNEVSSFLTKNGIDIVVAEDGKDGLVKLNQHSNIKLIISDVNMPNMDGLTMVEAIRKSGNSTVNIIMLTTESDPRMKARGKAAGVKGWIVKPFNGNAVLGGVKKLLGI
ncbi:MAG: two-component system chemotaxis response regulator CheY [Oleiphilaceae bacterium]|jgi:two-component system chemotaxis response regulator CheY